MAKFKIPVIFGTRKKCERYFTNSKGRGYCEQCKDNELSISDPAIMDITLCKGVKHDEGCGESIKNQWPRA